MKYLGKEVIGAALFTLLTVNLLSAADFYEPRKGDPWIKSHSRMMLFADDRVDYARWYVRGDGIWFRS